VRPHSVAAPQQTVSTLQQKQKKLVLVPQWRTYELKRENEFKGNASLHCKSTEGKLTAA